MNLFVLLMYCCTFANKLNLYMLILCVSFLCVQHYHTCLFKELIQMSDGTQHKIICDLCEIPLDAIIGPVEM